MATPSWRGGGVGATLRWSALAGIKSWAVVAATAPAIAVMAALLLVQAWALWRAPAAWFPESITIRLAPGQSVTLGAADLAAPRADAAHLQLERDAGGGWQVRNLGTARPASVQRGGTEERLAGASLVGALSFQAGGTVFMLDQATPTAIAFRHGGHGWRYDGATLYRDGHVQPPCADGAASARGAALWNRLAPNFATIAMPLALGGHVHCGNRLGIPSLPPGAAMVARSAGRLRLAGAPFDDARMALLVDTASGRQDARRLEAPLAGVTALSVAGGRYTVTSLTDDGLTLWPTRRIALYSAARMPDGASPATSWRWRQRTPWWQSGYWQHQVALGALSAAVAIMLGTMLADKLPTKLTTKLTTKRRTTLATDRPTKRAIKLAIKLATNLPTKLATKLATNASTKPTSQLTMQQTMQRHASMPPLGAAPGLAAKRGPQPRWRWLAQAGAAVALLVAGVAAMVAQRGGSPPAPVLSLLLAAAGAAVWQMPDGRRPLAVNAALVLAMAGLLMQLELGLAAPDLAALKHYHKGAALLAAGGALAALWHLWRHSAAFGVPWRAPAASQRGAEWALAALTAIALMALAAQALWGDETGVFELQPVELAKLALAALSAHGLALHLGGQSERGWRWLRLAAPALLFCALLGMALVSVNDYSPLILLALWAGGMTLAYAAAARRAVLAGSLGVTALALVAIIGTLRSGGPEGLERLPHGFYADRFQVWLAPQDHPHTGQQWLQGARAIAAGGWLGADQALGLRSAGMPDSLATTIPAVQDDFAPSFFLYRHGLLGALLLWCVQAAMLAGLLQQAARCHRRAAAAQGFRPAWRERLRCFLLCGGAAFLFGHLLLSWGTNLAIFPVMGQPMSFMSAGGSHWLFFLCPLLAVSMDAEQPS